MKKIISLFLLTAMIFSCFAGCATEKVDVGTITPEELDPEVIGYYSTLKLPIDTEGTTIKAFLKGETTDTPTDETPTIKELSRRTGLNVQIETAPTAVYAEKANIYMAAGKDLPDIIGEINLNDFGVQGAMEPINKHLDELPNLKEIFYDKTEEYKTKNMIKSLTAADGNIYEWPVWDTQRDVNYGFMYRKDIFDKHGLKMWNSNEEFYQTLKKLKQLYPKSSPWASKRGTLIFLECMGMWNIRSYKTWTPYYDEETKVWKQSLTDPKMKEILDFLKKLFDEGLLDPEFLTMTEAAWTSKMIQNDKAFITFDFIGRLEQFSQQSTVPGYDLRYAKPIGNGRERQLDRIWGNLGVTKSERSLKALKLLDYTISESGAKLLTMGVEGKDFVRDEKGFAKYIGEVAETSKNLDEIEAKLGLFTALSNRYDKKSNYYKFSEREQEAQDLINNVTGFNQLDPVLIFTSEEEDIKEELQPAIQKAAEEFFTKYVLTDNTGDKAWAEWLTKMEKLGSDKLVKIYNDAQVRFDKL